MNYKLKFEEFLDKMTGLLDSAKKQGHIIVRVEDLEKTFPELAESEDEKVRKELISHLQHEYVVKRYVSDVEYDRWIAWLEKQGEKKHLVNFDEAEKEKYDFVSGQFIECRKSFNEFKEDNSYWLEYIGDDTYIGRSDNILNKKFHITPRQLFTLFTWQHRPKEYCNVNNEVNAPTEYGKYVDECLNEASKHFFSEGEDKYSVADLFYAGVRCGKSWLERQGEQKPEENKGNIGGISSNPEWSEEDDWMKKKIMLVLLGSETFLTPEETNELVYWLQSLKDRVQPQNTWKPSDEQMELLSEVQSALLGKDCHNRFTDFMWELKKLKEGKV